LAIRDALGIEHDLHRLGVAGLVRADILVRRLLNAALHVAADGIDDARSLLEVMLDAPEAAAGKICGFGLHRLTLRRNLLAFLIKLERSGVEAVPLAGGLGAIIKDVAQMGAAARAVDLDPLHPVAVVLVPRHVIGIELLVERWP